MRNFGNLLLASLSESDAAALRPHLKSVHLEHEKVLFEAGGKVTDIYFPTGAIISLVVGLSSGEIIEAAMVGKDGVAGAFAALGGNIPVNQAIVQLAGPALTCKVSELRSAVLQSQSLLSTLFRHEQTVYAQASQSAACMAAHQMEARLCRWLLRSRDLARHGQSAIHPGISCGDVGRQENQRDIARAHASTGRNDKVFERPHSDHRC
jgi:CRP-like cAMP-binding protein